MKIHMNQKIIPESNVENQLPHDENATPSSVDKNNVNKNYTITLKDNVSPTEMNVNPTPTLHRSNRNRKAPVKLDL